MGTPAVVFAAAAAVAVAVAAAAAAAAAAVVVATAAAAALNPRFLKLLLNSFCTYVQML